MSYALHRPSEKFRNTYLSFMKEFILSKEALVPFTLNYPYDDFNAFLERLSNDSAGINLKEGMVASSTYWLIGANKKLVGVSNLRHTLTPALNQYGGHIGYGVCPSKRNKGVGTILLRETLNQAQKLNIRKILITCDKDNTASAKVILKNGGILQDEEFLPNLNKTVQRYWVLL